MRRASADQDPVGKLNKKESVRRRTTLPDGGALLSTMNNGQSVSDVNVANGGPSHRLETKKSDNDFKSVSAGSSVSFGGSSPPVQANNDFDLQKTRAAIANLNRKINHTLGLIKQEQHAQAEHVNEYLESVKLDRPNLQHTKSMFEKKNQKSTQTIVQLQSKLEMYQKKLAEVQLHGVPGSKEVLKNVSQGFKTMVSKPMELATMIKHKLGSVDNVNTGVNDTNRDSAEDMNASQSVNTKSLPGSTNTDNAHANHHGTGHRLHSSPTHSPKSGAKPSERSIPQTLQDLQAENNELRTGIANLKLQVNLEFVDMKQALEMKRDLCDRLEEQINDLTELHQNEMSELKQDLANLEEKMSYTLDDRMHDIQESLESCKQRVAKVEQQQLIQTDFSETSSFTLAKIVNIILALLSFCLILLSTLASVVSPFLSTRFRYILTFCFVICFAFAWKNWDLVSSLVWSVVGTLFVSSPPSSVISGNLTELNMTEPVQERDTGAKKEL